MLEDRGGKGHRIPGRQSSPISWMPRANVRKSAEFLHHPPAVPQLFIDVDRDKVLKQGVDLSRFTRRCRLSWAARLSITSIASAGHGRSMFRRKAIIARTENRVVLRPEPRGDAFRCSTSPEIHFEGPEFTMRYNLYRSADQWPPRPATVPLRHESPRRSVRPNHAAGHGF